MVLALGSLYYRRGRFRTVKRMNRNVCKKNDRKPGPSDLNCSFSACEMHQSYHSFLSPTSSSWASSFIRHPLRHTHIHKYIRTYVHALIRAPHSMVDGRVPQAHSTTVSMHAHHPDVHVLGASGPAWSHRISVYLSVFPPSLLSPDEEMSYRCSQVVL